MKLRRLLFLAALLHQLCLSAQSVEFYGGHQRAGIDLMWYKFLKNREDKPSAWLFFSRQRASLGYDQPHVVAFGSTNALSYNFKNGLGLVAVASFLNNGLRGKTGIQLVKMKGNFMFFGWLVADLHREGYLDLFGLFRYQPQLAKHWRLFSQIELFPVFNPHLSFWNLTQRLRLGVQHRSWTLGFMADFNQAGQQHFQATYNLGGFLRYDF